MTLSEIFNQLATSPARLAEVAAANGADVDRVERFKLSVEQLSVALEFLQFDLVYKGDR